MNWVGLANLLEHNRAVSMDMTNTNNHLDNADITQNYTHRKNWGFEFAGAAWAGMYTITA